MCRLRSVGWLVGWLALLLAWPARADDWTLTRRRAPRAAAPLAKDPAARLARDEQALRQRPHEAAALERLVSSADQLPGGLAALVERWFGLQQANPADPLLAEATARLLLKSGQLERAWQLVQPFVGAERCEVRLLLLAAELARARGIPAENLASQRRAIACSSDPQLQRVAREALLETLLEHGALAEARAIQQLLSGSSHGEPTLRRWPDALAARGLHAEAASALLELAEQPGQHTELLRDAAVELLAAGANDAALTTVQRALSGATAGARRELLAIEEEAYRKSGKLAVLAERLDASRQATDRRRAANLWDELGDDTRCEASLRAWLKASPRDKGGLRLLATLLQRSGRSGEAETLLRRLVQLAPNDAEVIGAYVALLRGSGRDAEAISLLTGAAASGSPSVQTKVSDLLGRMGQTDQQRVLLQRLIRLAPEEADHVIALGELELAEGDREAALRTWRGLLTRSTSRVGGLTTLAEVLGDHGLVDEALATLEQALALAPDELGLRRKHGSLLERAGRGPAAETAWQSVLRHPAADLETQREARAHLVSLWKRLGVVPMRARMLAERVRSSADDSEARRLLAELFARDPQRAENELELIDRLATSSGDDAEVLRALAALHVRRDDVDRALALLERLAELSPEGAVDNLGRAVDLSLSHYRDDDALHYAQRAEALKPTDPAAHLLTARVHQRRRELPSALEAYRRVVELRPSAFDTRIQLAELAHATGDLRTASDEWLSVISGSADDEQVSAAARRLMELPEAELLGRLERSLLSALQAEPNRMLFRRLLVEWYARGHTDSMAMRPLVETLDDPDPTLRESAIALLSGARVVGIALPLLARVPGMASRHEAAAALVAVGRIGDQGALIPLQGLLRQLDAKLKPAALWALLVLVPAQASQEFRGLLVDADASVRAMAALGLGMLRAGDVAQLRQGLTSERHPGARAALLWSLARLGALDRDLFHSELSAAWPSSVAALYGLRADRLQLSRALLGADVQLQVAAARLWRGGDRLTSLPAPSWPFDSRSYVASVLALASEPFGAGELTYDDGASIGRALQQLLQEPRSAQEALAAFAGDGSVLAPSALLEQGLCPSPAFMRGFWEQARGSVERTAVGPFGTARGAALLLLARGGRAGHPAISAALAVGADPAQRGALLDALAGQGSLPPAVQAQLLSLFDSTPDWPTRLKVARLLGPNVGKQRQEREPVALVRLALVTGSEAASARAPRLLCRVPAALN